MKINKLSLVSVAIGLLSPSSAFARDLVDDRLEGVNISRLLGFGLGGLNGCRDLDCLIENLIKPGLNWLVAMSAVVAVAMIIVAGYNLITSNGDSEKVQKGTKGITSAIIGLVIAFCARMIIVFVLETIGLQ
ncbi:MAG TPA: hypothetical protein PLG47_01990 [Candidatus Dojkabacteria bacterium]|jgi:hypothetical protein|nr:hypothetical protein [Candidatus Dojkabacteria bacterium]